MSEPEGTGPEPVASEVTEPLGARRHRRVPTPLGDLLVVAQGSAIVGTYFDGQKHLPDQVWFGAAVVDDPLLDRCATELAEYFAGERQRFDLTVRPEGTPFQQRVWEHLVRIPFGETTTYGTIAAALAPDGSPTPGLAQGVGQAVGRNPVSVLVPCHRVLGTDGSLTGFAGGLPRKRWLLAHEEPPRDREARLF